MPYTYVIDKERRLIVSRASGRVTFAEVQEHEEQLRKDPNFNPEFNQFVDGAAVEGLDITTDEAKSLARHIDFASRSRRAFFIPSPSIYGMLRLMHAHHELANARDQIGVFYNLAEALEWLGLKRPPDLDCNTDVDVAKDAKIA